MSHIQLAADAPSSCGWRQTPASPCWRARWRSPRGPCSPLPDAAAGSVAMVQQPFSDISA